MTTLLRYAMPLVFLSSIITTGCDSDDPIIPNEEELITTLRYTLIASDTTVDNAVLTFVDLDGDGGQDPIITTSPLKANTTYVGTITLLNEAEVPTEDITLEVEEEAEEHQFFFDATGDVTVAYDDADADGRPVGLTTLLTTGVAGTAKITITLRHEPAKSAAGVAQGDISNAGGETDIEVTFDLNVEE